MNNLSEKRLDYLDESGAYLEEDVKECIKTFIENSEAKLGFYKEWLEFEKDEETISSLKTAINILKEQIEDIKKLAGDELI